MEPKQSSTIIITAILTTIIVGGGVYLWQTKEGQPSPTQPVNVTQDIPPATSCSELGSSWIPFSNRETSLSFCFKNVWGASDFGETAISPEARIGTVFHIGFSNSVNNFPLISYSTLDFQKLGDSDVPDAIDWKSLDFSKSDAALALLLTKDQNATVQKLTINGKQVLKAHNDFISPLSKDRIESVEYFLPNVTINGKAYNLRILGSPDQEIDLDKLLGSMVF